MTDTQGLVELAREKAFEACRDQKPWVSFVEVEKVLLSFGQAVLERASEIVVKSLDWEDALQKLDALKEELKGGLKT